MASCSKNAVSGFSVSGVRFLPQCGGETDLVGVRILDDEPIQRLGMACDDSESDRSAVVLNEQAIVVKSLRYKKKLQR